MYASVCVMMCMDVCEYKAVQPQACKDLCIRMCEGVIALVYYSYHNKNLSSAITLCKSMQNL